MALVCNGRILLISAILAGVFAIDGWSSETSKVKLLQMLPNTSGDLPDRGPATGPQPSGNPGDPSVVVSVGMGVTLPNPVSYYAINMVEVDEEGGENNPCFLRLWGNMVDPQYSRDAKKRRLLAKYELPTCGSIGDPVRGSGDGRIPAFAGQVHPGAPHMPPCAPPQRVRAQGRRGRCGRGDGGERDCAVARSRGARFQACQLPGPPGGGCRRQCL